MDQDSGGHPPVPIEIYGEDLRRRTLVSRKRGSLTWAAVVEEVVGGLGPDERVAAFVPALNEPFDGGDQLFDAAEAAAADGLAGDDREEDLDQVQPRPRGRGEMQRDPRVARQPRRD